MRFSQIASSLPVVVIRLRLFTLGFDHLSQLRFIGLRALETKLARDERELWHFLAGFLPHRGFVKLRQLLQLLLGKLLGIDRDCLLLEACPMQVFV